MLPRGIGKILAPIFALGLAIWGLIELSQALNKIKMIVDAINFIFGSYNSATSAWVNFTLWKGNATLLVSQPIFNAFPILDIVPGIFWDILKAAILIYFAIWILDRL
jgi:hypothetical protein